jgi:hypothetical protein
MMTEPLWKQLVSAELKAARIAACGGPAPCDPPGLAGERPNHFGIHRASEAEMMESLLPTLRRAHASIGGAVQEAVGNTDWQDFLAAREQRRKRSLQSCHRFSLYERPRHAKPKDTGAFVPQASAVIENDRNLTDGARRCARKIMELAYRSNRDTRTLAVTVTYLAKALGKCCRSVQRYLRLLEREGYVQVQVVTSERARMCCGLVVELLDPLFPRHHRKKWPEKPGNPDATQKSQNESKYFKIGRLRVRIGEKGPIPVMHWAERCMDGVHRAFLPELRELLRTIPPIATV